jgi:hypothetical protein
VGSPHGSRPAQIEAACVLSKSNFCQALETHACNSSWSGGSEQEDHGSDKKFPRPYIQKTYHKKGLREWLNPSKKEKATFFIEELASSAATFLPLNLLID